jgi:hypothetical protein
VGHWIYTGQSPDELALQDIVVKQGSSKNGGFHSEAELYLAFNTSQSLHIPKLYRQLYVEQGSSSVSGCFDSNEIHRMFLEYYPGGDLHDWQKKLLSK